VIIIIDYLRGQGKITASVIQKKENKKLFFLIMFNFGPDVQLR